MRTSLPASRTPQIANGRQRFHTGEVAVRPQSLAQARRASCRHLSRQHATTPAWVRARGFPPKVIWLRLGNCSTAAVEQLLRRNAAADIERVVLELYG